VDGSEGSLYNVYIPMGMTAENVAEERKVSREAQDEWALISQTRAVAAQEKGHFDREIIPVTVPAHKDVDKEGNEIDVPETVVTKDDGPRPGTTLEKLAALKPVFKPDGTVTAGNACPLNDGAAAVLVMFEEKAAALGPKHKGHGDWPDPGDQTAAAEHWHEDRGHRHGRDQRGVRRPDRAVHG
jgi:acetyl-CoA C-acetyltransferase